MAALMHFLKQFYHIQVFGADASTAQRPDQVASLSLEPVRPNQLSQRINNVVAQLRKDRPTRPALFVIRQGDPTVPSRSFPCCRSSVVLQQAERSKCHSSIQPGDSKRKELVIVRLWLAHVGACRENFLEDPGHMGCLLSTRPGSAGQVGEFAAHLIDAMRLLVLLVASRSAATGAQPGPAIQISCCMLACCCGV